MLSIELIPRSSWGRNLRITLGKGRWKRLSQEVRDAAGGRCEICGSMTRVQCDEQWSFDDVRHVQRLVRLRCVCQMCHHVVNFERTKAVARAQPDRYPTLVADVISHFMLVNGVDRAVFDKHRDEAIATWSSRSAGSDWTIDFGDYTRLTQSST